MQQNEQLDTEEAVMRDSIGPFVIATAAAPTNSPTVHGRAPAFRRLILRRACRYAQ